MECSLPFKIGTNITIKNYNTFLHNYGSSGYKFKFQLNSDKKTGEVYIIGMASTLHEDIVFRLLKFFDVPNNGVVDGAPIKICPQPCKRIYSSLLLLLNFQYSYNLFI